MAPTEMLAEQHFRRIAEWLAPLGVRTHWLAGRLGAEAKRAAQAAASQRRRRMLAIGTHALIQDAVNCCRGSVLRSSTSSIASASRSASRCAARRPGDVAAPADAQATPIPRTLAMSFLRRPRRFGDRRAAARARGRWSPSWSQLRRRDEVLARIRRDVAAGRQAYWVCPLVEERRCELEAAAATETHERIARMLPELRIGLLHGQLPARRQDRGDAAVRGAKIDVLVATTVIEVGVDVPNATLMVIEHAERFGLAQLHQLRGRVGRGAQPELLHPALRRAAVGDRARATQGHLRDERWLRGGPTRPYDAGPGRVPG